MCHHLTIAVHSRDSLAPLRELGVDLEGVELPRLPETDRGLRQFRVTRGWCACDLIGRESLAAALATIAAVEPRVLVHLTFGDAPGHRPVGAVEPHDVAAFALGDRATLDRWVRLRVPFSADGPVPRWLDGARVIAVAAAASVDGLLAIVRCPNTPGATLLRCDREWSVLDTEWFADVAAARDAASGTKGGLQWVRVPGEDFESE